MKKILFFLILLIYPACAGDLTMDNMENSSDTSAQETWIISPIDTTVTLMHYDGTDAGTTWTDEANRYWYHAGTAQLDTAKVKIGTAALLLDGVGDYLRALSSTYWDFGNEAFTIEAWVRPANTAGGTIVSHWNATGGWTVVSDVGILYFFYNAGASVHCHPTWVADTWYHVAVGSNGVNIRLFVDGVLLSDDSTGVAITPNTYFLQIGCRDVGAYGYNGSIDELRVTKGVDIYGTTNFTPDTTAYTFDPLLVLPQIATETTIISQGSYALKLSMNSTGVEKAVTKTFTINSNLTNVNNLKFDLRAIRTGPNIKIGIHDTGGTTTEFTPDLLLINTYQTFNWNISQVTTANKDNIDKIILTFVNTDEINTCYVDNFNIAPAIDVLGM